jgi:hypothetical protein
MATILKTTFDQPRDRRAIASLRSVRNRLAHSDNPSKRDQRIIRNSVRSQRFHFESEGEAE